MAVLIRTISLITGIGPTAMGGIIGESVMTSAAEEDWFVHRNVIDW
jgi:hypothetical protein